MVTFRDTRNPTGIEIEEWAYDADALAPHEGFEDILSNERHFLLSFIRFASDANCPKRAFFVSCLYEMGELIWNYLDLAIFINILRGTQDKGLIEVADRLQQTRKVLKNKDRTSYDNRDGTT